MHHAYEDLINRLADSPNPIIRYKTEVYLRGRKPNTRELRALRDEIAECDIAKGLIADLEMADPNTREGVDTCYHTLKYLADIDYPAGNKALIPYRDHVYAWLRRLEQQYHGPLFIRDKYRVHASFHGNAIYASVVLGIANEETGALCDNLLRYQWPGGGWNCNKIPNTKGPTIVHTAFGMRGLVSWQTVKNTKAIKEAIHDCAEVLLTRQVYLKRTNGKPLRPVFVKLSYPYPRLYDFMVGLHIVARAGYVTDPRCQRALALLESKFIDGEGWKMERKLFHHNPGKEGFTNAHWEDVRLGAANQFLTVDALEILKKAGRF